MPKLRLCSYTKLVWILPAAAATAEPFLNPGQTVNWPKPVPITCSRTGAHIVVCDGVDYTSVALDPSNSPRFWYHFCICTFLVLFAGLMSGLTIGLLSLDSTSLLVLKNGGSTSDRIHATRILPLVERKHVLLVTLLLCNAGAMEALPVFLGHMVPEVPAILLSVTAVLLFGEIIPQAVCSKYGLAVGYYAAPLVWLLMLFCTPISFPIGWLLDRILGVDHGQFYRRQELKELVALHGIGHRPKGAHGSNLDGERTPLLGTDTPEIREGGSGNMSDEEDEPLTFDEVTIIRAAIEMTSKTVGHAMTPLEAVLVVNLNKIITYAWVSQVLEAGHSRIPIYEGDWNNIIGFMMVRNLVLCDVRNGISVREMPMFQLFHVDEDYKLYDMLNKFQTGKSHMAVVHDAETNSIGIITLEDVIEELINEEIVDETDVYVDVQKRIQVERETNDAPRVYSVRRQRSTIFPSLAGKATGHMGSLVVPHEVESNVVPALTSYAVSSYSRPYDQAQRLTDETIVSNRQLTVGNGEGNSTDTHITQQLQQQQQQRTLSSKNKGKDKDPNPTIYRMLSVTPSHTHRKTHRKYTPTRIDKRIDTRTLARSSSGSPTRLTHAPLSADTQLKTYQSCGPVVTSSTPATTVEAPAEIAVDTTIVPTVGTLESFDQAVSMSGGGVSPTQEYVSISVQAQRHTPQTHTQAQGRGPSQTLLHANMQISTQLQSHTPMAAQGHTSLLQRALSPLRPKRLGPTAGLTPVNNTSDISTRSSVDSGRTVKSEDIQDVPILSPNTEKCGREITVFQDTRRLKRRSNSEY